MRLKSGKSRNFLLVGFIFMASWLGYWVGYMVHHTDESGPKGDSMRHRVMMQQAELHQRPLHHPGMLVELADESDEGLGALEAHVNRNEFKLVAADNEQQMPLNRDRSENFILLENIRVQMAKHAEKQEHQLKESQPKVPKKKEVIEKQYSDQKKQESEDSIPNAKAEKEQPLIPLNNEYYALIHSGVASRVHGQIHEKLTSLPQHIDPKAYIFEAKSLPANSRQWPSVGNGHVATVVHSTNVHMNALYNGYQQKSHRAIIPSTCALNVTGTQPETSFTRTYRLNTGEGIYSEISESESYTLTQRLYAHRELTRLLVVEIDLVRKQLVPMTLNVKLNKWTPSRDITFLSHDSGFDEVSYKFGRTNAAETDEDKPHEVHVVYDHVPNQLTAPPNQARAKWVFLSSLAHTKEDAFESYKQGAALIKNNDALYARHVQAWSDVWASGRIDVAGNLTIAKAVYGAQYYLMSSMVVKEDPLVPFVGLSPSGLPYGTLGNDYQGHVFWDQETWMYPPILFFHDDLGKLLLGTRTRTANNAEKWAKHNGRQGMQFPWESAFTGWDVTPAGNCSKYELHISGDISYAIAQYLYATNDTSIIQDLPMNRSKANVKQDPKKTSLDILAGVAHFWVSTMTFDQQKQLYVLKNVMPPDEDAGVRDNSVYTNTIAKMSMENIEYALSLRGVADKRWKQFVDKIYIPFDTKSQYHPEYDGYKKGTIVKQADTVLLGYPLQRNMPHNVRMNDLEFYQKVTKATGPAMTWAMFSVGWLDLGDAQAGHTMFNRIFSHINPAFQVWSEVAGGQGAANFLTGIGGFLQNIIAGYGGFHLHSNHLAFNPTVLPPGVTSLNFVDIDYLGSSFDFYASGSEMIITLTKKQEGAVDLVVFIEEPEQVHTLMLRQALKLQINKGVILAKTSDLPGA